MPWGASSFRRNRGGAAGRVALYSGKGLLRDAVHGVGRIRDRSAKAKQHNADEEAIPRKQRHSGDKILDELLRSLAGTWFLFQQAADDLSFIGDAE